MFLDVYLDHARGGMMDTTERPMKGKTAMVTGATSGMDLATAEAPARLGATVVLAGRDPARGAAALQRIKAGGGDPAVDFLQADLSSQQQIRRVVGEFVARYPRLEVPANNAGATGAYWAKKKPKESSRRSYHAGDARRLWRVSEELTGLRR